MPKITGITEKVRNSLYKNGGRDMHAKRMRTGCSRLRVRGMARPSAVVRKNYPPYVVFIVVVYLKNTFPFFVLVVAV